MESSHGSAIEGEASLNSENQAVINEHYEGMNDDDMDYEPTDGSAEDEFLFEEEEDDDDDEFQGGLYACIGNDYWRSIF